MSNIKFSQLPDLANITANTIVPVVSANVNYTVTAANLQTFVNTSAGNITGGNLLTGGVASAGGNITGGNLLTGGVVSATGNITGNYILGNGSQLTGLPALYGNANVVSLLAGFGSNTISTTGTVTAGNITGGNVLTGGVVSATGNITGNYILGNGSALTGLPVQYDNANVVTLLASFGSNSISTTGNITAGYFAGNGAGLTNLTSNVVSNVISGGNNFANTVAGNGRMWINGGKAATGNLDAYANNSLWITSGDPATSARIVLIGDTDGNISIQPASSTSYVTINGLTINNGNTTGTRFFSQRSESFTFFGTAGGFGSTAGFNATQLTKTGTSTGTAGDIAWDANYIYVCTGSNVWKRTALSSF
jgi:hypothetical protein